MKYTCLLLVLSFAHCTLHHYSLNREPIQIKEAPYAKDRKKVSVTRSVVPPKEGNSPDDTHLSYNSDSLEKYLSSGSSFDVRPNSPLQISYKTNVKSTLLYPPMVFLWFITLGVFPVFEEVDAEVQVSVQDGNSNSREYTYMIKEHNMNSWLSIPTSIIMIPHKSFSHSFFHMFDYPQKFIANYIENDILQDMKNGNLNGPSHLKNPVKNNSAKSKIAILPITHKYSKDSAVANAIRDKVETVLVNKKMTIIERVRMDAILKELKLSQSGLTDSDQIRVGNMLNATNLVVGEILEVNNVDSTVEFSIRNIELESGRILWKHEFTLDETNLTQSLNSAIRELDSRIPSGN